MRRAYLFTVLVVLGATALAIPPCKWAAGQAPKGSKEGPEVGKTPNMTLVLAESKPWLARGKSRLGWSRDGKSVAWREDGPSFNLAELQFGPRLPKGDFGRTVLQEGERSFRTMPFGDRMQVQMLRGGKPTGRKVLTLDPPTLLGSYLIVTEPLKTINIPQPGKKQFEVLDAVSLKPVRGVHIHGGTWSFASSPDARYLLLPGTDGTLQIYNSTGKCFLRLYVSGNDWIGWTPEGYYAATPGGEERLLHCKIARNGRWEHVPIARFRKQLYRPDVIGLLLEKGNVAAAVAAANAALTKEGPPPPAPEVARDVADLEKLVPPAATLTIVDRTALPKVKIRASAVAAVADQPVTALRLLVDGRPLPDGAYQLHFDAGKKTAEAEWTVTLPPGPHHLAVIARSPDASAVSNSLEVKVADPDKRNTLHVLAIGINAYEDSALKLEFAAKDAQEIAAGFKKCSQGELFSEVRSDVLIDAAARKETVLGRVAELRKKVKSGDLAVVFFAGHGVKQKDKFYLLNVEARVDDLAGTAISGSELRKALGEFPCQVLLMLDACHSSAGLKSFRPAVDDITRQLTDDECGVAVLCAAMAHEKALEKGGNGLFTRAVVDGLSHKEGVPFNTESQLFYVHHLHSYVFDRVSGQSGGRQHPFLSLPWVVESFPVAKFTASTP